MNFDKVVAIDGPSGSGKSSIAKEVSKRLNFVYVDTGAMYRAIGYYLNEQKIKLVESKEFSDALKKIKFCYADSESVLVKINDIDLTLKIREHKSSELASIVSQIKNVRELLTEIQREIVKKNFCIMEGRDIGTVVFPNSFCKIYLTAKSEVRAKRRLNQLVHKGETGHSYETIIKDIIDRDERDMNRAYAPLKKADDAIMLDTSDLNEEEVNLEVIKVVEDKLKEKNVNICEL